MKQAGRRRDKAHTQLDKATATEEWARVKVVEAHTEVASAAEAVQQAKQALAQDAAAPAELQNAVAQDAADRANSAGYRSLATAAHVLVSPEAAATLAD